MIFVKNYILSALAISWRLRRHFVALCATQLITNYFSLTTSAQAPQGIPYQAIARNASGVAIANTAVKVRFSIRDSIATGPVKYQETHNPTTSALGLFSINVGMGTVVSGSFSGINWGKNAKFLQVELDPAGGGSYADLGTTQMMSVPYSLHSKASDAIKMITSASGDTLYTGGGNYLIIPGISAANPTSNLNGSTLTDIDGNVYQTVRIGTQVWMKENLKVSKYRNGDAISTNLSNASWSTTTTGAYAVYNNDSANNTIYGKLYNWYSSVDTRGLCPIGWHVPTDAEWTTLENFLGGISVAGGKMKAFSSLWFPPNTGATNESGFSALPGGFRFGVDGQYFDLGLGSNIRSTTEASTSRAWIRLFRNQNVNSVKTDGLKRDGFSVRCLKD
jgi:uncharacterized protein (TIGR02145 family)